VERLGKEGVEKGEYPLGGSDVRANPRPKGREKKGGENLSPRRIRSFEKEVRGGRKEDTPEGGREKKRRGYGLKRGFQRVSPEGGKSGSKTKRSPTKGGKESEHYLHEGKHVHVKENSISLLEENLPKSAIGRKGSLYLLATVLLKSRPSASEGYVNSETDPHPFSRKRVNVDHLVRSLSFRL